MQNMYCNFKKVHKGKVLKDLLWKISRSTNELLYKAALDELEEYDKDALNWVMNGLHPTNGAEHTFLIGPKVTFCATTSVSLSTLLSLRLEINLSL